MPLMASAASNAPRENPPTGPQQAVCAFVEDIGWEHSDIYNKDVHKCVIVWELAEKMSDGRPFMTSKKYTISLSEKANLRKDLESWRGRPFTDAELAGFDLEKLKGAQCMLNLMESTKQGKTYVNVAGVMPMVKGMQPLKVQATEPPKWIAEQREKNKENMPVVIPDADEPAATADDDTSVPF